MIRIFIGFWRRDRRTELVIPLMGILVRHVGVQAGPARNLFHPFPELVADWIVSRKR